MAADARARRSASPSACSWGAARSRCSGACASASPGLYPVATLGTAAFGFGAAATLHGSGFLAVYLVGLTLGGRPAAGPAHDRGVPRRPRVARPGRPVRDARAARLPGPPRRRRSSRGRSSPSSSCSWRGRSRPPPPSCRSASAAGRRPIIGWAGLRGAVPVVLATFVVVGDVPGSEQIFDIVFFAVVISTLLQGTTVELLAGRLGLTTNEPALPRPLADAGTIRRLGAEILEYPVTRRGRDRRAARPRPRAPARGGRERHRPR